MGLTDRLRGARRWWAPACIVALSLGELAYAAWLARLLWSTHHTLGPVRSIAGVAAASALAGIFTLRLEFRRHQMVITLAEAVFAVGLFAVAPLGLGIALVAGDAAALAFEPIGPLKTYFNLVNRFATATTAGALFAALTVHLRRDSTTMLFAALLTAICYSLLDVASTSAAVSISERSSLAHMLTRSGPPALLASAASAPLGIVAVVLARPNPIAPLILVPTLVAVAYNARYSTLQRAEHLRFERLYETSVSTAELDDLDRVLARLADAARKLVTGASALCTAVGAGGEPHGVVVDDAGATRVSPDMLRAVASLVAEEPCGEVGADSLAAFAELVPADSTSIVYATAATGAAQFAVAVFRTSNALQRDASHVETLRAFATHGALVSANARLFGERDDALRQQIDLNRQKGDFVATVSHELRTPLAAAMGSIETVLRLDSRLVPEDRTMLLELALARAGAFRVLVDDLLTVAASEHGGPHIARDVVDVGALLDSIRDELHDAADRVVVATPAASDVRLRTDRDKLHRIVRNLVENATKYAPSGPIEIAVTERTGTLSFAVRDHGPGVPDTRNATGSSSASCRSISRRRAARAAPVSACTSPRQLAEALGGSLTLESPADGGSRFVLTLPTTASRDAATARPQMPAHDKVLRRPEASDPRGVTDRWPSRTGG